MLVSALRDDGWIVRSFIIWSKGRSFDPDGAGSVMPESVAGWRWTRHRIKVGKEWQDCPGCAKCEPEGLVLRKGSWRPTHAYDVVLMLAKTGSYFSDDVAVREAGVFPAGTRAAKGSALRAGENGINARPDEYATYSGTRNLRDCWYITPQPRKEAHYATFADKLVETIIKAATSEAGVCARCGAPWARLVRQHVPILARDIPAAIRHKNEGAASAHSPTSAIRVSQSGNWSRWKAENPNETLGWRATCTCDAGEPVPATVLDPFCGIGTTLLVARELGRHAVGVEISQGYCQIAAAKLAGQAEEFKRRAEEEARRERDRNLELRLELERTR